MHVGVKHTGPSDSIQGSPIANGPHGVHAGRNHYELNRHVYLAHQQSSELPTRYNNGSAHMGTNTSSPAVDIYAWRIAHMEPSYDITIWAEPSRFGPTATLQFSLVSSRLHHFSFAQTVPV